MFGNYVRPISPISPISPILEVPSALTPFQNAQINFYNPISGFPTGSVIPVTRVTNLYNSNGVSVEITGTQENVTKAIGLLNIANNMPQPTSSNTASVTNVTNIVNGNSWQYVKNPANLSKYLLTTPNTSKPFSGSGLIIIEKNNKDPYVLLAKTATRGTFEDLGGELDTNAGVPAGQNSLKYNATKEAIEESQNLFVFNTLDLERNVEGQIPYIDIDDVTNNALYRCYIVVVDGTVGYDVPRFFSQNKIMTSTRMNYQSTDWKETVELRRFSLQNMQTALNSSSGGINFNDISNVSCTIRDRTANCLRILVNDKVLFNTLYRNPASVRYVYDRNFMSMTIGMHVFRI